MILEASFLLLFNLQRSKSRRVFILMMILSNKAAFKAPILFRNANFHGKRLCFRRLADSGKYDEQQIGANFSTFRTVLSKLQILLPTIEHLRLIHSILMYQFFDIVSLRFSATIIWSYKLFLSIVKKRGKCSALLSVISFLRI